MTSRYALVHQLAREKRRKLANQSRQMAIESTRRLLEGIALEGEGTLIPYAKTSEPEYEHCLEFTIEPSGAIPEPNRKPI